ncbi:MAG: tRNA 2-thiouridine(34) synthase MnmA [Nitrospirae bacterium]|nr:tRNA 2-thiouridine(34) synthase MnmA [Nitrospirota bacterium]
MKKAVVGMSGGVDSSFAAYMLKEAGYDVTGVSFVLYEPGCMDGCEPSTCCSITSVNDAASVSALLGIKHKTIDLRDIFRAEVIEPFVASYSKGMTPNPCVLCNMRIKFPHLLKSAQELGADIISTGHYAQVEQTAQKLRISDTEVSSAHLLKKGVDEKKDQSYVLYGLSSQELSMLRLPLGSMTKSDVRRCANMINLPSASRPESQEICFVEGRSYLCLLDGTAAEVEGPMINVATGKEVGRHKGIHRYTIGQRKRLGVASLEPLFVVKIDPAENRVYVGSRESAMMREFSVSSINWLIDILSVQESVRGYIRAAVKVRSTMKEQPATIELKSNGAAVVVFDEPQWAPAPGQSAVFYHKDIVLGGGVIDLFRF